MFPLKDSIPSKHPSITLWLVIGLNVLAFLIQFSDAGTEDGYAGWIAWSLIPAKLSATDPTTWYPLVTSQFLHGGLGHLASNLWILWIFGDNVEDRMGPVRFAAFYLLCGCIAGLAHVFVEPNSPVPTIGASGAVAGVLGAYLLLYPRARVLTLVPIFIIPLLYDLPATVFLGIWFVLQILNGSLSLFMTSGLSSVAWFAHVGGFVAGFALCRPFAQRCLHPRRLQRDEWTTMDLWRRMR